MVGPKHLLDKTIAILKEKFLLEITGDLNSEGSTATFLGRRLQRVSDSVIMAGTLNYYDSDLKFFKLEASKPTPLPSSSGLKRVLDGEELASSEEHAAYRRAVGKLQSEVPISPTLLMQ